MTIPYTKVPNAIIEKSRKGSYVYLISMGNEIYKIGISKDPHKRLAQIQTCNPYPIALVAYGWFEDAIEYEAAYHDVYCGCRLFGERFSLSHYHAQQIKKELMEGAR